jgi:hypothetical protein
MEWFLPYYVNFDLNLPETYSYSFGFFFNLFKIQIDWTDIKSSQFDLDVADTYVDLVQVHDKHLIHVEFPAIRHWEVTAHQHMNTWFLPRDSAVALSLQYIDFNFQTDLKLDKNGYLDPYLETCSIDIGKSKILYSQHLIELLAHETFDLMVVIIEQSVSFIGEYVFTHTLGPLIDAYTNHYQFEFWWWSQWPGKWDYDKFSLDARNVRDP